MKKICCVRQICRHPYPRKAHHLQHQQILTKTTTRPKTAAGGQWRNKAQILGKNQCGNDIRKTNCKPLMKHKSHVKLKLFHPTLQQHLRAIAATGQPQLLQVRVFAEAAQKHQTKAKKYTQNPFQTTKKHISLNLCLCSSISSTAKSTCSALMEGEK
jgi:hypothetical protein